MSIDWEAAEALEARPDMVYFKALADAYDKENPVDQPPKVLVGLSEREIVVLLSALQIMEGVQEDDSIRGELEDLIKRFWKVGIYDESS